MKLNKKLALAATISMVLLGAGSADAETVDLCKAPESNSCPLGESYTGQIEAISTHILLSGILEIKCTFSEMVGGAIGPGKPLYVTQLTFTGCSKSCTVSVLDETGQILTSWTGSNQATGTARGFKVSAKCGSTSCMFGGVGEGFAAEGGSPAIVIAEEVELEKIAGGSMCGTAAYLEATYAITSPKPIYIAKGGPATETVLCTEEAAGKCPEKAQYTGHIEALSTSPELLGVLNVTCSHSKVLGEALGLANPLVIHISELTFTGCSCTVNANDKTGLALASTIGLNEATGIAEGFSVLVQCGFVDCVFGGIDGSQWGEPITLGGEPATITATEVELEKLSGGFFCGSAGFLDAEYTIVLPKSIYVAS